MKTLRYVPVHGSSEPVSGAGIEFTPGVERQVDDATAALLLKSRFFVEAASGKNPNFVCTGCKADVFEEGIFDPIAARISNTAIKALVADNGTRKCAACMNKPPVVAPAPTTTAYITKAE